MQTGMAKVVWSDAAAEQLQHVLEYVELFDPVDALRLAERLHALADGLSTFPNPGRPGIERNTREVTTAPPYLVTYEVTGELVAILDIPHGRQAPHRLKP